jgi:simple sugar transport system ATP-binding protein
MSVLFISAELEEVLRLSHRVAVLRDRRVVADLENDGLTVDALLALIADGSVADEVPASDATTAPDAADAPDAAEPPDAAAPPDAASNTVPAASAPDSTTDPASGGPR